MLLPKKFMAPTNGRLHPPCTLVENLHYLLNENVAWLSSPWGKQSQVVVYPYVTVKNKRVGRFMTKMHNWLSGTDIFV